MRQEDFIIQNIEVKKIGEKKLASIYVNFKGNSMPIMGPVSDISPMHICYDSKRPKELNPMDGVLQCYAEINEYFTDLTTIIYFLNNDENLNDLSIFKAVEYVCEEHIKRSGRLIDSDLFSYIDLTIIAKHTIWSTRKNHTITQQEAENLWVQLQNNIIKNYENYIYITKYDISNLMEPKPYLVKLK